MTDRIDVRRYPDAPALARAAAVYFVESAQVAIMQGGRFSVGLSGGSTPEAMHRLLATEFVDQVAWDKVHVFWGDERSVPPEHEDSNYRMAKETLLDHVPIPATNIHRIRAELPPQQAAADYAGQLHDFFGIMPPIFDLILLGMGNDGHTASLFPYTNALNAIDERVLANFVPKLDTWRITLTAPTINAAARVAFLVAGEGKAQALHQVIKGEHLPDIYPAQLIDPVDGALVWLADDAAAVLL